MSERSCDGDPEAGGLAVVIGGGAMRCLYALGAVQALIDSQMHRRVETIHCVSSGVIPASLLWLACQNGRTEGFVDELGERQGRLIRPWRLGRMIDLAHLCAVIDEMVQERLGDRRDDAGVALEVALTESASGRRQYFDLARLDSQDRRTAMAATMAFPLLYSGRLEVAGTAYLDGGVVDPLPVRRAIEAGADEVIAVMNKPPGHTGDPVGGMAAWILRVAPGLTREVRTLMLSANQLGVQADRLLDWGSSGSVSLTRIAPSDPGPGMSRSERNEERLRELERAGYQDARRALAELARSSDLHRFVKVG